MKKRVFVLLMVVVLLIGCSNLEEETNDIGSVKADKLVVYSPQGDEIRGTWIMDKAKEDISVDVQFLCAGGGELADRLVAEKNNPQADVVMGLTQDGMYRLKREEVLEPYEPEWSKMLPEVYKERENYFNSFWQTPIVIAYNPDYITYELSPKSWEDLARAEFQNKYGIGSTGSQTTRTYLIGLLWEYYNEKTGDISQEGWELLTEIYTNAGSLPTNDSDIWKAFKDGEIPILPWWYGGVVSNTEKNNIPVEYVIPENGTPVVAEAIGLVKGTQSKEEAEKFINWFGSAEVMAAYAEEFGQAPAHPEAIALCSDRIKEDAEKFTAQNIDWEIASEHLDSWLEKIELEIMP